MQTIQLLAWTLRPSITTSWFVSISFSYFIVWSRPLGCVNTKRGIFTTPAIADIEVKNLPVVKHYREDFIVIHSIVGGNYGHTLTLWGHHPNLWIELHHLHAGPVIHATSTQRVPQIGARAVCLIQAGKKLAAPWSRDCSALCQLPSTRRPPSR